MGFSESDDELEAVSLVLDFGFGLAAAVSLPEDFDFGFGFVEAVSLLPLDFGFGFVVDAVSLSDELLVFDFGPLLLAWVVLDEESAGPLKA